MIINRKLEDLIVFNNETEGIKKGYWSSTDFFSLTLCILATFFALISTTTFDFLPIFLCFHFVSHTNLAMFYRGHMKFEKHAHSYWKYSTCLFKAWEFSCLKSLQI